MVREAQELLRRDKVAEAIEAYKRILMQWPSLADCWFNLGYLLRRVRDHDGALLSYQKALELGVSEPESAHLNRAVIYADHLRQDEAAEDELKAALALNPDYVPALLNYANLHEDRGERADAAALYERVLVLDPTCFLALARHAGLQPRAACDAALADLRRVARGQRVQVRPQCARVQRRVVARPIERMRDDADELLGRIPGQARVGVQRDDILDGWKNSRVPDDLGKAVG